MSENTPGYYVPQYPDQRPIITLDVLNMEILHLRAEVEKIGAILNSHKNTIDALSAIIAQQDGWESN